MSQALYDMYMEAYDSYALMRVLLQNSDVGRAQEELLRFGRVYDRHLRNGGSPCNFFP